MLKNSILIIAQDMTTPLDRRVWLEANTLKKANYQVAIICPNSKLFPKLRERIDGIDIFRYPQILEGKTRFGILSEYFISFAFIFLYQVFLRIYRKIDAIQICNPPDFLILTIFRLKKFNRPKIVYDQHDVVPELWFAKGFSSTSIIFRLLSHLETYTQTKCDAIIFASESFKTKYLQKNLSARKHYQVVKTAPNKTFGLHIWNTYIEETAKRESILRIAYLGRMGNQDNVQLLLESLEYLIIEKRFESVELHLIGDGPLRKALEIQTKRAEIEKYTFFHGYISNENDLCNILRFCQVAVCPDLPNPMNDMASMNKIAEYMCMGLPIIQFNLTENAKTAQDCSIVVEEVSRIALGEAILELWHNQHKREHMSKLARNKFLNDLSWESQESKMLSLYEGIFH